MSNKIDSLSPEAVTGGRAAGAVSTAGSTARSKEAVPAAPESDSVKLTGAAVSLQRLESSLKGGESFDAAKVERVRSAIAAGTFKVDPQAIAGKLVELERSLAKQG